MDPIAFIKSHPYEAGAGIFVVGLGTLWFLGFFGGSTSSGSSSDNSAAAAYYAAESQQAVAGDELQAVQIETQGSTTQDLINASADVQNNTTWANADVTTTQDNNQAAVSVAPFQTEDDLISTLGQVASIPPTTTTTTSTSKSSGFLGIGGGSKASTVTTTVPNPASVSAAEDLSSLMANNFGGGL